MSVMRIKNDDGTWSKVPLMGSYAALVQSMEAAVDAQTAATNAQNAAKEVKEIYGDGNFTPLSDLLGSLGTKLKRWGTIFANKVFASNLPIVYNSVAEMKADTMLWEGMNTKTLGYYEPNDGGSASYLIRAKADSDTVDNGSLHELANGLVAELIIENGTVCPEQFGAKGDGVTDDSSAIKRTIDSGKDIYLSKTYFLSEGLIFKENVNVFGGTFKSDSEITLIVQSNSEWENVKFIGGVYPSATGENIVFVNCKNTGGYNGFNIIPRTQKEIHNIIFKNCISINTASIGFATKLRHPYNDDTVQGAIVENVKYIDCIAISAGDNNSEWATGFCYDCIGSFVSNISFVRCKAIDSIESGFHFEYLIYPQNIIFLECISNGNGLRKEKADYGAGYLIGSNGNKINFIRCEAVDNKNTLLDIYGSNQLLENMDISNNIINYSNMICKSIGGCVFMSNNNLDIYSNLPLPTTYKAWASTLINGTSKFISRGCKYTIENNEIAYIPDSNGSSHLILKPFRMIPAVKYKLSINVKKTVDIISNNATYQVLLYDKNGAVKFYTSAAPIDSLLLNEYTNKIYNLYDVNVINADTKEAIDIGNADFYYASIKFYNGEAQGVCIKDIIVQEI